jgi:uncharacterized protein with gpF-like domain
MINLYKKFTPSFQNIVRKFAIDCWYGRESEKDFIKKVSNYRKRFKKELISFYKNKGLRIDENEIENLSLQWQAEQIALAQTIKKDMRKKENKVIQEKKEEIYKEAKKKKDFVPVVEALTSGKLNKDFLKKANQLGDESSFDLVSKINNLILLDNSDKGVFRWVTQGDNLVRPTHRKLDKKIFAWNNLPKIDGEEVEPGSQWGCRCYAEITTGKPLKNYEIKS